MSPAEYIELVQAARSDVASFTMNFMTVLFAFLTMVYFVGKQLSVVQLVLVSVLYTFLCAYLIGSIDATYGVMYKLMAGFQTDFPELADQYYAGRGKGKIQVMLLLSVSWLMSVGFLLTTRFSKDGTESK